MFESFLASEQANKAALLLVNERYVSQLAPFVKDSSTRLTHVRNDIDRIIDEVCDELGADRQYVANRFEEHLAAAILNKDHAKREKLKVKKDWVKNVKEVPQSGNIQHTNIDDEGEVAGAGEDEARTPDARVDLNKDTQKGTFPSEQKRGCFRCGNELHPRVAAVTSVCHKCTEELVEKAADYMTTPNDQTTVDLRNETVRPTNPENMLFQCSICGRQGTEQEITQHVERDHADVLRQRQQEIQNAPNLPGQPLASKEAAPADKDEQAIVEPLPQAPGDEFDDMVQDLANRAAAIQFSTLEDKDYNALAESLGVNAEELKGKVQVVAVFDNYVGVNGDLQKSVPDMPEGYQEVQAPNVRAAAHEALVPSQIVINKVAEKMNMPQDLAYNMVKDSYGGSDLPDKYHAAVNGEYHFYVPAELAAQTQDVANEQGEIGPTTYAPSGGQPSSIQPTM